MSILKISILPGASFHRPPGRPARPKPKRTVLDHSNFAARKARKQQGKPGNSVKLPQAEMSICCKVHEKYQPRTKSTSIRKREPRRYYRSASSYNRVLISPCIDMEMPVAICLRKHKILMEVLYLETWLSTHAELLQSYRTVLVPASLLTCLLRFIIPTEPLLSSSLLRPQPGLPSRGHSQNLVALRLSRDIGPQRSWTPRDRTSAGGI